MKIHISVESDEWYGDNYIRFKAEYSDVLRAEAGLRDLVEKYQRVRAEFEPHDCHRDDKGQGACEICDK